MRCRRVVAAVWLLLSSSTPLAAQSLPLAEIEAAIQAGLSGAKPPTSTCHAGTHLLDVLGYTVSVTGPVGRIMRLAAEAKKKYQPFTAADVPGGTADLTLAVGALPDRPSFSSGRWWIPANAEHVVIKPRGGAGAPVLQPLSVTTEAVSWGNAAGGKFEGQGLTATFSLDAFRAIPGDELDIAIVSSDVEKRCKIGKKDRAALR